MGILDPIGAQILRVVADEGCTEPAHHLRDASLTEEAFYAAVPVKILVAEFVEPLVNNRRDTALLSTNYSMVTIAHDG
jgi:hypothetical protein